MSTGDPTEDTLSVAFPLPYRVLCLVGVGLLAWATNLHGLHRMEIDVVAALDLRTEGYAPRLPLSNRRRPSFIGHRGLNAPARSHTYMATPHFYRALYRVCAVYFAFCFISWVLYRLASQNDPDLADKYGYIPAFTALIMVLLLLSPFDVFFKHERDKFHQSVRRCFLSSSNTPVLFSDVILADIGTSFAKVLGDVWLSLCMLIPGNSMLHPPPQLGLARWVIPTLMSLPYLARFRQCVIEYNLPSNESNRPLFNAIKYATAFPVIYLSAAQGLVTAEVVKQRGLAAANEPWQGQHYIFRLWLLAVFVNSLYSFWWDVSNDWGLDLLRSDMSLPQETRFPMRHTRPHPHPSTPLITEDMVASAPEPPLELSSRLSEAPAYIPRSYPYGLRPVLLFPLVLYPILIIINLMLRMSWTTKLATHLHASRDGSMTILLLEISEILRRWLWVFIRVEWEVVKKLSEGEPKEEPSSLNQSRSSLEIMPDDAPPPSLTD
ncbi:EXS-domain-containing protein [Coprinopsis marcescibilis]|uniref:EXS-domain-containing protein n=1 Tax=Coprinopsis marcescibilis TaxID=230819 RepID=A0A5C3KU56_COPMA|nr:EXS-domain-containing protein [Coprinopsis marcescibilis]